MGFLRKFREPRIWKRVFLERLTEPLHLNVLSLWVGIFGTFRQKIAFDLILRQHNAFSILMAATDARKSGLGKLCVVEFGVAAGAGFLNMCEIAKRVTGLTGVDIEVFGFDTGKGMPKAIDYRDHPELYREGDFPMDVAQLQRRVPSNGRLVLGELSETVPDFLRSHLAPDRPLGYAVIDVDYYSSTVDALKIFGGSAEFYLPTTIVYLDDIQLAHHNPFAGELLAVSEFNAETPFRKICRHDFFENTRIFRNADWIKHIYYLHVMDHPTRVTDHKWERQKLLNPYLAG